MKRLRDRHEVSHPVQHQVSSMVRGEIERSAASIVSSLCARSGIGITMEKPLEAQVA